jgi:hypothetical protein
MALGAMISRNIGVVSWQGRLALSLATAMAAAVLAMVLARLVWAVLAGLLAGAMGAWLVGWFMLGDAMTGPQPAGWQPTPESLAQAVWFVGGFEMTHTFAALAGAGLILGLFLPRATVIAATSAIGVSLVSGTVVLLTFMFAPDFNNWLAGHPGIAISVFFGIFALGVVYQSIKEVRAKRAARAAQADDAPADYRKPPRK